MTNPLIIVALIITLLPLGGSLVAGLLGSRLGHIATHRIVITLIGIFVSFILLFVQSIGYRRSLCS